VCPPPKGRAHIRGVCVSLARVNAEAGNSEFRFIHTGVESAATSRCQVGNSGPAPTPLCHRKLLTGSAIAWLHLAQALLNQGHAPFVSQAAYWYR